MDTEKMIEFDKVKDIWAGLALTEKAKKTIEGIRPFLSEAELLKNIHETSEFCVGLIIDSKQSRS